MAPDPIVIRRLTDRVKAPPRVRAVARVRDLAEPTCEALFDHPRASAVASCGPGRSIVGRLRGRLLRRRLTLRLLLIRRLLIRRLLIRRLLIRLLGWIGLLRGTRLIGLRAAVGGLVAVVLAAVGAGGFVARAVAARERLTPAAPVADAIALVAPPAPRVLAALDVEHEEALADERRVVGLLPAEREHVAAQVACEVADDLLTLALV